jgi:hypothetical protein
MTPPAQGVGIPGRGSGDIPARSTSQGRTATDRDPRQGRSMTTDSYADTTAGSVDLQPVDVQRGDGAAAAPGVESLVGPVFAVIRAHRIFTRRFNIAGVSRFSTIFVTLTEVAQGDNGVLDIPFIGNATMKLYNVAPRDGGQVDVRGEIDWDSDLNIKVSFVVF